MALSLLAGCSHAATSEPPQEGGTPPAHRHYVDGGALPDVRVACGDATCPGAPQGDVLGEIACCRPSGACGLRVPALGNRCLETNQPGNADPECPSLATRAGAVVQGCCSPAGRCGYYDRFGALGCVVADTTDAGRRCTYTGEYTCRSVVSVGCDGPEDCPTGNTCCARFNYGLYDLFGCFPSCETAEATDRGVWFEVCHSAGDCETPAELCAAAEGLAPGLRRCVPKRPAERHDAGASDGGLRDASSAASTSVADAASSEEGVTCGSSRCSAGRTCCTRDPEEPYCANRAETCSCDGPRRHDE